ncbi:MAG: 2-C-methyl-D-erythritol 2,4-cyclodiphosphate synthase [Bacilli bacterium]|nr:2-C-methyl-D-erythritol 2,4-cyclodiphosphate synthase [Bacilli bacterium]MCH4228581.1 2-C-methyl-D-erythritol 2,4-cyclodiphosphate synthase [Bacilli bacterium]MCH4277891.1 2-C-methyl-D-erythritol 2,4-cyclodiphosphate synthase [Bacilli bacterium]
MRIGYGEDIHRLVPNRKLILCGVKIPFDLGLLGHSDADVGFHALSDALLGSLGLGDIGKYFPPSDPNIEGIDSLLIVKRCLQMVNEKGYKVSNVDLSLITEEPHLAEYIIEMKKNVAMSLLIDESRVSIKAMTNEGLDAIGRGEAIKCVALVLVTKE